MISYVVGFAFDDDENVALIRKEKPDWQKGYLNGPGGKIEEGESSHDAMVREFEEETGLLVPVWEPYVKLAGEDWSCAFFRAFSVDLSKVRTVTDEQIMVLNARYLPPSTLTNLTWLIPLALDLDPSFPNLVLYGSTDECHAEQ